eukprot:SAG25_NODE_9494_length_370_cov_0.763838_1_plen_87_part_01
MASLRANATLDRSTLTFYTSDNGAPNNHAVGDKTPAAAPPGFQGANWPLRGYKGSVWEASARHPLRCLARHFSAPLTPAEPSRLPL